MVHKIKLLILGVIIFCLGLISINLKGNVELNLTKTLLPSTVKNSKDIITLTNKSASVVKVVFESDDEESVQTLKTDFLDRINKDFYEVKTPDISNLLDTYLAHPNNFLSPKTRELLKSKQYDEIYANSLKELYNPAGIQLTTMDKDPYFLLNDFLNFNKKITDSTDLINDKHYDSISLYIKTQEGLTPNITNKEISKLIKIKKQLSKKESKIYLAGTPIHSYNTSRKSVLSINFICVFSTLLIVFLTHFYFKRTKLLIPISLSIIMGMLTGYIATRLVFENFQIITMVFSATLIGIGIDYSYHYFFSQNPDKTFVKNLTFSLITTLVPFILLFFTKIDLLEQISVFMCFGLLGIYFTVFVFYPCFEIPKPKKFIKPNSAKIGLALIIIFIFSLIGYTRFHFNDTLTALYAPSKTLQKSEALYNKVSGSNFQMTKIVAVEGLSINDVIEKEEKITDLLYKNGYDYISVSKFIPSKTRQRENFGLVKDLYVNNLDKYSDILSQEQITTLKQSSFVEADFQPEKLPHISDFMLDKNKSMIFVFENKPLTKLSNNCEIIDIKSDIEKAVKSYRTLLLKMFLPAIAILLLILIVLYRSQKGAKILIPPMLALVGSVGITSLIFGEINIFSIIAMYMVLGFTMDYSIFRANPLKNCEDSIFASALTTSFSFLLLSLCGFKLLSSIALILFWGIVISYLCGYYVFKKDV